MEEEERERRKSVAENFRMQIDEGLVPKVIAIFPYGTHDARLFTEDEFIQLQKSFEEIDCENIAGFISFVIETEKEVGMPMSYNLALCPRNEDDISEKNVLRYFAQTDILIGTRWGKEAAGVWFQKLAKEIPLSERVVFEYFDLIFKETLHVLGQDECLSIDWPSFVARAKAQQN